jgi:acetolactate synthase regulatory subunit
MIREQSMRVLLRRSEGALLRLIGTVQRRGFEVVDIATFAQDTDSWLVMLKVESARELRLLERQVEKLYDVIELVEEAPRFEHPSLAAYA